MRASRRFSLKPECALLVLALLTSVLVAGCDGGEDGAPDSNARERGSTRLSFRPSGRSDDLLCVLPRPADQKLPSWITDAPGGCYCDSSDTPTCYHIDIGDDRRRSLVLSAGAELRGPVRINGARWLRFSVAALGNPGAVLEVHLRVAGASGEGPREWYRRARVGDPWVDASIDVSSIGQTDGGVAMMSFSVGAPAGGYAFLALAAPRLVASSGSLAGSGPTNVLVYLIDTLRPDHMSVYGYARPTTPRLEALAREGMVFENAYSAAAWTRPSTASLFTSLHSSFHGAHSDRSLAPEVVTIAERFREGGWSTWAFVTNGHVFGKSLNFEQGFDRFVAIRGVKRDNHARTEEVNEILLPHLDAFHDEPFFMYVHTVDPHSPYDPPEDYRGLFTDPSYAGPVTSKDTVKRVLRGLRLNQEDVSHIRAMYDEDIRYQDDMLGVLLDRLRDMGLASETIVVVTSDHGEEFFEHRDWEHGTRLYEEQVRIPLLMSVPGATALAGRRIQDRVQIMDIMPTLLGWYGMEGVGACQGQDLAPLLLASGSPRDDLRSIYCEEIRGEKDIELFSLTEGSWKIIHHRVRERERYYLFDLAADPQEQRNRARTDRDRLIELKKRLEGHGLVLARAFVKATGGRPQQLDEATRKQLEALGYLDAGEP